MALQAPLLATVVLDRLRRKSDAALAAGKEAALVAANDFGPSEETGHPYATGAFIMSLRWRGSRLISDVDHAYFADRGFTRAGEGTARRWRERGAIRFGEHYAVAFLSVFREVFARGD